MARLFSNREWRLAAAGIAAGMIAGLIVVLLWVGSPRGRVRVESPGSDGNGRVVETFHEQVAARLGARPVARRPLAGTLILQARDVVWREPGTGQLFVRAPSVSATIDASAANRRDIVLGNVVMSRPLLELVNDGRGWNYERPLAGLLEDDRDPAGRQVTFRIASLRLIEGTVRVDMPGRDFTLTGVDGRLAAVELAGPGLPAPRLELVGATAKLEVAGEERVVALGVERGHLTFPEATTVFEIAALTIAGARLEQVTGVWDPGSPGYGVSATGRAPRVRLADLQSLALERVPADVTASFAFTVEPTVGDGTALRIADLSLVSGEARVTGSLAAEVMRGRMSVESVDLDLQDVALALVEPFTGPLPYRGTVSGLVRGPGSDIRLELTTSLTAEGVAERIGSRVTGTVGLTRDGLTLREVRAELTQVPLAALRPLIPGLPLTGLASGSVALSGSPSESPLRLSARFELGRGLATVGGTLDLTGSAPGYELTGRLVGIDLQSMVAQAVPPVTVTAQFAASGTGFEPESATGRLRLAGSFSGWRASPGDTIALAGELADGSLRLSAAAIRLAGASVSMEGSWRFLEPAAGGLQYRLTVADLAPFGPFLPVTGDSSAAGSVRAEGTISGLPAALRLDGAVEGTGVRAGRWGADRIAGRYAVVRTAAVPDADVQFEATDVTTADAGTYSALNARMRLAAPELSLEIRGEQAGGGELAVRAHGTVPDEGSSSLQLESAWLDLRDGRWQLQSPARLEWGGPDGVRVTGLQLRNVQTAGAIALDGRILPLDEVDAHLVIADLPLHELQLFLGREPVVTGKLWADFLVKPPGSAPVIQGTFRLAGAVIEGVALSGLEGSIDYAGGTARTELSAAFDSAAGRLEIRGTLPLRVVLGDSLELGLSDAGPIAATVRAERVSLQPLGSLIPRVRNLAGQVDGDVSLEGTVADPQLGGQLTLSGGRVQVPELNQRFEGMGGTVAFSGRTASIRDLSVQSGGWARARGTLVFEELGRPVLELAADLDGFQPIGVDEHPDAAFNGTVDVAGELDALVVTGRVSIHDGYLTVPQFGAAGFDPDYLEAVDPTPVLGRDIGVREGGSWAANARLDGLRAIFGEGAWVEAFDATLQLRGSITIDKAGEVLRVTGTLEGERGTYTLTAGPIVRRFEITSSQVRFLGSDVINPAIDITARRIVLDPDGRRVEVEVRITGTARTPRLSLASADAPDIPESELLSFLLFGRRTLALGQTFATTSELVFEQTLFGGVAEVAGLELERALSTNLGLQLDLFQVRFGQGFGGLTTPTFVLGRQVSNDFFLTVESGLNALFGDAGAAASSWAVRLEWAIDPRQALELGIEPLNRARLLRGIGAALPPGRPSPQQLYAEYRRRWAY